jgi:hypothetical protein
MERTLAAVTCGLIVLLQSGAAGMHVHDPVNQQEGQGVAAQRRLAPLAAAGIDMTAVEEVIKALDHPQVSVRLAAVYALKMKKASSAVTSIRRIADDASAPHLLRLESCDALADLVSKDASWKDACASLIAQGADTMIRIRAAGVLARVEDPRGWSLVKDNLLSSRATDAQEAAMVAHLFDDLVDPNSVEGQRISVPKTIAPAFPGSDEASQLSLVGVLARTARASDSSLLATLRETAKSAYVRNSLDALIAKVGHK